MTLFFLRSFCNIKSNTSEYQRRQAYILIHRKEAECKLPDIGSYSTDLSTGGLSYYKLVKDLVEKNK